MGWRGRTLLLMGVLLLPGVSAALDLDAGLRTSAEWDSNVRRTDGPGQTDDFIFRVTPLVRMMEDDGKFHWNIDYRFPYEFAVNTQQVDGFRHFLSGNGEYFLSERTRLYARNDFSKSEALSRGGGEGSGFDETVTINSFNAPVYRNRATVGVSHNFSPRTSSDFSFTHRYFDTDLPNRAQSNVFASSGRVSYAVSPRHRVGGGASATLQDFAESNAGTRPASQTFFLNVFASWVWLLDETTTLTLAGGPTFIDDQQDAPPTTVARSTYPFIQQGNGVFVLDYDSCGSLGGATPVAEGCSALFQVAPADVQTVLDGDLAESIGFNGPNPGQVASNRWTFFGEASLAKRWSPVLSSDLSYRRTDSTASGLGSAVLDSVRMLHHWRISERWSANFIADFTHRQSTAPVTQVLTEVQQGMLTCLNAAGGTVPCNVAMVSSGSTFLTSREVDTAIDTNRWGLGTSVNYRITRHLSAGLRYRFNSQASAKRTEGRPSDFGNHLVTVGVQYDFDRYSLDKYVPW